MPPSGGGGHKKAAGAPLHEPPPPGPAPTLPAAPTSSPVPEAKRNEAGSARLGSTPRTAPLPARPAPAAAALSIEAAIGAAQLTGTRLTKYFEGHGDFVGTVRLRRYSFV